MVTKSHFLKEANTKYITMDDKSLYTLSDAASKFAKAARNIEFLTDAESLLGDEIKAVNLYIVKGYSRGYQSEYTYTSSRGVKELTIPEECWPQIRDILVEYYRKTANETLNEIKK